MDELEQLKGNFLRSLKAAEEQSGLDLSWLKVQYMQLYEAAQQGVQRIGCTCPLIDDNTMGINPLCVVHGELANR